MSFFSHAKGERFRFQLVMKNLQTASGLINEPKLGGGLADFCVSALEFANALVNSPEDVRARMHLRSEFLDLSMERVLQVQSLCACEYHRSEKNNETDMSH